MLQFISRQLPISPPTGSQIETLPHPDLRKYTLTANADQVSTPGTNINYVDDCFVPELNFEKALATKPMITSFDVNALGGSTSIAYRYATREWQALQLQTDAQGRYILYDTNGLSTADITAFGLESPPGRRIPMLRRMM